MDRFGLLCWLLLATSGCARWGPLAAHHGAIPYPDLIPNPLPVVAMDEEFVWNQIVDTVDDYFRIEHEVRMRADGGVVTDGFITTIPTTGATYLEPWRGDSTAGFERLLATLQSIRRRANVRVSPTVGGFDIEIAVYKELEDVAQPEHANVGASTLRHDGSLVRNEPTSLAGPATLGWSPQGRDLSLEQRILAELRGRLANTASIQRLPKLGL